MARRARNIFDAPLGAIAKEKRTSGRDNKLDKYVNVINLGLHRGKNEWLRGRKEERRRSTRPRSKEKKINARGGLGEGGGGR